LNFTEFLQPAIFALTGKPGAGKSYFATRCIIAEITQGNNRTIVTNVPINRQALRAYVKKDFNLYDLETFSDNRFFFSNRGHYQLKIDNASENLDFGTVLQDDDEGILYIIDEAHLYFNARNWKHMMGATLSYITFIRHIGDTCIYMCQKFSDIDSQFRGKTQAFHLLRNLDKERFGWFKRGNGFRCYQYLEESHIAAHGNTVENAVQDFTYPFKMSVAECYNTSLFNKSRDKKYKVTGIPVNYMIYFGVFVLACVCYWLYNGGFRQITGSLTPEILTNTNPMGQNIDGNLVPLPNGTSQSQAIEEPKTYTEIPIHTFRNSEKADSVDNPYQQFTDEQIELNKIYWSGDSIKTKITFFSDKDTTDNKKNIRFGIHWSNFKSMTASSFVSNKDLFQISTPYFESFATYVKSQGFGVSVKETQVILKENIPFKLKNGFQLPFDQTFSSQGVVKSSRSYQQVGFELALVFERINEINFLKVEIENSDVLDISSSSPILQTFSISNVLEVLPNNTYQIADFNSETKQKAKGFLSSSNYESIQNNKIFLSFGTP